MKYVVILADGMADYPLEVLDGKTPMAVAKKPTIDRLAAKGEQFLVKTIPDNLKPGSDVANLSVMGYDTKVCYTGRSPLEAASIGVTMAEDDISFRANLVSLGGTGEYRDLYMQDYSAGEISTAEACELIGMLKEKLTLPNMDLYAGVSYRHLLVWHGLEKAGKLTPPHDISDKPIRSYLPENETLLRIMMESRELLREHPINRARREKGLPTADSLWFWGEGKKPRLANFYDLYQKKGAMISAVDLLRGIGFLTGMQVMDVPGVTGNIDTNFQGKAEAAVKALLEDGCDMVYVHMEAPDECGHRGELKNKIMAIEMIDTFVVQYITEKLSESQEDFRMLVLPDHPTPISTKTHASDAVPCLLYDSRYDRKNPPLFTEESANCGVVIDPGHTLMKLFLQEA